MDGISHQLNIVRDLGDKDNIGTAGKAGAKSQPAGLMAHDLDDNNAMMAVGSGMQAVDGLGGNGQRCVITEGNIGHGHVIINGLGQGDDVESLLRQAIGVFLGSAAADADQRRQGGDDGSCRQ